MQESLMLPAEKMPSLPARSLTPNDHEMMVFHTMAEHAVSSKMYKGIGEKAGVMMIMLSARELGIPPMQALNGGINIIQGKVEISARMMSALIRKAGHQLQVKECLPTHCVLVGKRCDTGEVQSSSFSVAEAQQAGIFKQGGGWTKFPKDMCFARALSRLARQLFSDVIGMGYIEGEISQSVDVKCEAIQEVICDEIIEEDKEKEKYDTISTFLHIFDESERVLALEYLSVVQKHFEWTEMQAIKELLKEEKKLLEKFNAWKLKNKKQELL